MTTYPGFARSPNFFFPHRDNFFQSINAIARRLETSLIPVPCRAGDQYRRLPDFQHAEEFSLPLLLMHGVADTVTYSWFVSKDFQNYRAGTGPSFTFTPGSSSTPGTRSRCPETARS